MKKLYTIGETAKIVGISVQTLRNYSDFPFLKPASINEETGYRYYSFEQFHIIDRIKYLRRLGLSLKEIEEIMVDGEDVDKIISYLENRENVLEKQIEELYLQKQDLRWYLNYFKYLNYNELNALPHVTFFEERYILHTLCGKDEEIEEIEIRLAKLKLKYEESELVYRRQFGYLLQYEDIIKRKWNPTNYFIYLANQEILEQLADESDSSIMKIPAGDYFCFSFRLYHMESLQVNLIKEYFKGLERPMFVIANEHEDNLIEYKACPYELQILLKKE
ncbi:MAG: MerR family transcriptional regulator [Eubacteriales bacterium]